jgi:dipeptidyl aminopeptidase/acylaminoacyl peptidase
MASLGGTALVQSLAQLGFVTFVVETPGTDGRGRAFRDRAYQRMDAAMPDHAHVLGQLAADRPWMDTIRVGIIGWSNGGYNVLQALLTRPDTYHVGVAVAPMIHPADLHAVSAEPHFGLLPQDAEVYERGSVLRLAGNLTGKLLLVHGTSDVNAPIISTMRFIDALARAGRSCDQLLLPEAEHDPWERHDRYLYTRVAEYLTTHLLG